MINLSLNDVAHLTGSKISGGDVKLSGVTIDSRKTSHGDLFVALRGENFDGHDFLEEAKKNGATAFLVEEEVSSLPAVTVGDTRKALGCIAKGVRDKFSGVVIGITGSNGKTTVKELVASILRKNFKVLSTHGNLNNDIGVPLTLFGLLRDECDVLVAEMGSNQPGEIEYLTAIVQPNIATITNVGHAHLQGLKNIEGVLQEKSEIFKGLRDDPTGLGYAVFSRDSKEYPFLKNLVGNKNITFGSHQEADVRFENELEGADERRAYRKLGFSLDVKGQSLSLETPLMGSHNILNIQSAIATVFPLDIRFNDIRSAVAEFSGVPGRLQISEGMRGCTVIDDSYNANIDSLKSAVDVLCGRKGRRILILGGMQELGNDAERLHIEAGIYAKNAGVDLFIGCGSEVQSACLAWGEHGAYFSTVDDIIAELFSGRLDVENAAVLVKGSRSSAMEKVVYALQGRQECCLH